MLTDSWKLDRYARFICNQASKDGEWKHYDDSRNPLVLAITDVNQLIISHGFTLLESHNLVSARLWMRGIARNDSLMFMYKFQKETRRFRVRFRMDKNKTGVEVCSDAVQQLSQFILIKISTMETVPASTATEDDMSGQANASNFGGANLHQTQTLTTSKGTSILGNKTLEGEITLGSMAQAVLNAGDLPQAYYQTSIQMDTIPQLLRICLADPTFPAFVESVDTALKAVIDGSL